MLTPDWLSLLFISFFSLHLRSSKLMEPRLPLTPLGLFNFAEFCRRGRLAHQKDFSPPVNRRHFPAQLNFRMQRWWLINTPHCRVISRIVWGEKRRRAEGGAASPRQTAKVSEGHWWWLKSLGSPSPPCQQTAATPQRSCHSLSAAWFPSGCKVNIFLEKIR